MPSLQRPLFDATPAPAPVAGRTALELFAGVGLARMGLERAGWEVVLANDIDPAKRAMYEGHFGPTRHYVLEDIHTLAARPDEVPEARLAHASFPCTDLSLAGARRGIRAGQSSAFWGFVTLLEGMRARRPALVLIENVTGLLTSHGGEDFREMLTALAELGYSLDAVVLDAAHFVPQSRPRLFVIGKGPGVAGWGSETDGVRNESADSAGTHADLLRPPKLVGAIHATSDLPWSLADLPAPPPYGATTLESVLDRPPADSPEWWSRERAEYLLSQMSPRHRAIADAMIAAPRLSFGTVFRRVRNARSMAELRTDGLAGCLRTPKGGSGRQILFQAGRGDYQVRLLNAAECARLMGADGYRVTTRLNQALFGFGDAVCVDAVAWIADNYLNRLVEPASEAARDAVST